MPPFNEWCRRVWYLLNRRKFEDALLRDMEAHRDRMERPSRFGNTLRLREEAGDAWGWRWLDDAVRDVRLSVRTLSRSPMFTATSVLILSLGIGVNLALFQLINAALIRPLPLRDLPTLVRFDYRGLNFSSMSVPSPMATFVEAHNSALSAVLVRYRTEVVRGDGGDQRMNAAFVSTNWFNELGAAAAMGRLLGPVDDAPGAAPAVVVSYDFWQRQLAGRPFGSAQGRSDALGNTILINGRLATIVGVAGADFPDIGMDLPSAWMAISHVADFIPGSRVGHDWDSRVQMFARVRPGVSLEAVKTSLQATIAGLREQEPARVGAGEWLEPAPGSARFFSAREAEQIWIIVAAVSGLGILVLMIACLNLSNLALARAMSRVREMSIRMGLGAGRWRVIRHMLTESVVVATLGSAGGLLLGLGGAQTMAQLAGQTVRLDVTPDWRLGVAMLAVALFAMLAVGLIPAWKIGRTDLAIATRDGGERVTQSLHAARLRYVLVTAQIAGSCLLLVFTAQLARSLHRALEPEPGFEYANVAVFDPPLGSRGFGLDAVHTYWRAVRQTVEAHPEVSETALTSYAPLSGGGGSHSRYKSTPQLRIATIAVEPAFFALMRIPILAGRPFEPHDDPKATTIISRRVALEMYGTLDVVGRSFPKAEPQRLIVGVAGDAHFVTLQAPEAAEQYVPMGPDHTTGANLLVRARSDPARLLGPLRQSARAADERVLPDIRLMRDDYARLLQRPRLISSIAGGIAVLALGLACLGICGVVSHGARLRTKEVGIRLALGAPRGSILRTLLRRTIWAAGIGITLGLAGSVLLTGALSGAPFYVQSRDPVTYVAAALTLAFAGAAAALVPTLRTLRADPLRALRQE